MSSGCRCWRARCAGRRRNTPAQAALNRLPEVKIAGYAYDRVRAIQDGRLSLDGFDVRFHAEDIYSLNKQLFGPKRTYEVSETGLIPYVTRYANEDFRAYTLIPVFISRTFRHRNIFVRTDSGIEKPEDLRGKRVGTPGYGMSSHTWIRGFLQDVYGVKPDDMQWIETTKSSDGGKLNSGFGKYFLPKDFPLKKGPEGVDESEMLIAGDVDALITAIEPKAYADGTPEDQAAVSQCPCSGEGVLQEDRRVSNHARGRSPQGLRRCKPESAQSTLFHVQPRPSKPPMTTWKPPKCSK